VDDRSLQFLEELSNAPGPSGFEREAMLVVKRHLDGAVDMCTDRIGSLVFTHRGIEEAPVVLLPGHIDEVGFVVTSITPEGFLTFYPLGYWWDQALLGHQVEVLTRAGPVRGVIAAVEPYATEGRPADKTVARDAMFIDIGASNREEAAALGARIGDAAVPYSRFFTSTKPRFVDGVRSGERTVAFGKALDNRVGAFLSAELVRILAIEQVPHPNTVVGAATVQEELLMQGGRTVAHMVRPDVAIALDVDVAGDVPGTSPAIAPTKMGEGVSITTWDPTMVPNQALKELCIDVCERSGIPYQLSHARGGTDAGVIHATRQGVPSIAVGPPVRHMHSHLAIADLQDIEDTLRFLVELVKVLDRRTVDALTAVDGLRCGL